MKAFVYLIFPVILVSCGQLKPVTVNNADPFPVVPTFQQFSKQPVISEENGIYKVTDEFMVRATQEHTFLEKVLRWKTINSIR